MSVIEKKPRSLIMCVTPLQMIIAKKIIELKSEENFDLIVIALSDNEKYRYYYERLKRLCVAEIYYSTEQGIKGFLNFIKILKINKLDRQYQNLYLASIDSRHFQYVLSKNKKANVYTFDDGTVNIIPHSLYYLNSKPKLFKRVVWRGLGIKCYMEDIKKLSLLHYTIYKDVPNIIAKTQLIKLYKDYDSTLTLTNRVVKIYLGQPLEEISDIFTIDYIAQALKKLHVDFYYPHPRENSIPKGEYKVIASQLVFEDYIVTYLRDNPKVQVHVYSFISSTILNIVSLDRVEVSYIHDSYLYNNYKDFYNFSLKELNISLLKI